MIQSSRGCLDNSPGIGNVVRWTTPCSANNANQLWEPVAGPGLRNVGNGKCLDVPNANFVKGATLKTFDCNQSPAQQFKF
jgi:hypothetical protein